MIYVLPQLARFAHLLGLAEHFREGAYWRNTIDVPLFSVDERGRVGTYHKECEKVFPLLEGDRRGPRGTELRSRTIAKLRRNDHDGEVMVVQQFDGSTNDC